MTQMMARSPATEAVPARYPGDLSGLPRGDA